MLGNETEKGKMIILGRYNLPGFSNTFCEGCSNFYADSKEKAKTCTHCLEEVQPKYYRMKDVIESIEVIKDENGRNVVKAVIPI